ncbi:MAG TPA: PspA/IM30 family protein [Thermomicrobiales bacterium]|nr:PspA/IM30 family protein [Thermomicrobiales bacterium]
MGILDRISTLVRANVNDLLDKAEDPEKMLDQILRDMQTNQVTARQQVASMIAQEKELEAELAETQKLSAEWGEKARRAVAAGKDDLAREALRRKKDNDENTAVYQQQYDIQLQTVEKLKQQLQLLDSKYQTTLSHRDSLIARQRRAKATAQVAKSANSAAASLNPLDASSELDRMERKIRGNEAQAQALLELDNNSFDTQFRELDYDVDIEKELEALKSGSSAPSPALAAGDTAAADDKAPASN